MSNETYRWHYDYSRIAWDTGFCFNNEKSQKTFDRNSIALLNIERIIRERDIGIVEHHIQNILEYNLDNEEARILDPNFVKLFRLSQLAVEYLIYCKKYLDSTVTTIKKDLQQITEENDDLKHDLGYYQSEVHKLKKKVRDLKATLQIVQKYKPVGVTNEEINTFQCNECSKLFVNADYLKAHILRRHPNNDFDFVDNAKNDENQINNSPIHTQFKAETDRLQMEIKSLKEKLNNTERFFQNEDQKNNASGQTTEDRKSDEYYKGIEKLHEQFELLKTQIESELHSLKEQKNDQTKYDKIMEQIITKLDEKSSLDERDLSHVQTVQVHKENDDKEIQVNIQIDQTEADKNVIKKVPSPKKQSNGPKLRESPTRFIKVSESPTKLSISSIDAQDSSKIQTQQTQQAQQPQQSQIQDVTADISKVKEEVGKELEEKTKQSMKKLSEEITETMSKTFGKFQQQLESFWTKLQDFEVEREKQKLESQTEAKQTKTEAKQFDLPKEIQSKHYTEIMDSDTESSRQEIVPKSSKSSFSMYQDTNIIGSKTVASKKEKDVPKFSTSMYKDAQDSKTIMPKSSSSSIYQNEKDAKNLIAELKTAVQQRNISKVQEKTEEPRTMPKSKFVRTIESSSGTESSSSSSESEVSEDESESGSEIPIVDTKSSKTLSHQTEGTRPTTGTGISTLQNRSTRSLENALHDNPEILEIFKNDLNEVVSSRLKDLGIDPEWTRIPNKTFEIKSDIVAHERNMAVKNIKSFLDIRQNIIDKLEAKITEFKPKEPPENVSISPEPDPKPSKFKSIFTQMRNKAKSIIKSEKPLQSTQSPNKPIYKLTVYKNTPSPKFKKPEEPITKTNTPTKKLIKRKQDVLYTSKPIIYETDSDSQISVQNEPPAQTSKQPEKSKKLLRKSRSDSSMEILEISDISSEQKSKENIPVAAARSMDSIIEMKNELKTQLNKSIENMNTTVETIDVIEEEIEVKETQKIELENLSSETSDASMEYEQVQKSVLKHTTIVGAAKKRVLFDLHSDEKTPETPEINEPENVGTIKKTIVKSTTSKFDWNDSSSLDSSIFDLNKKESKDGKGGKDVISTRAIINVSKKNDEDDLSDFVISDIN